MTHPPAEMPAERTGRPARGPAPTSGAPPDLMTRIRLADGRIYDGALAAGRHRRIHLGLLHRDSDDYVEIAAGPRPTGGKLRITTRKDTGHFLPGGARAGAGWLEAILLLVARHDDAGDEVCAAPAVRSDQAAIGQRVTAPRAWSATPAPPVARSVHRRCPRPAVATPRRLTAELRSDAIASR